MSKKHLAQGANRFAPTSQFGNLLDKVKDDKPQEKEAPNEKKPAIEPPTAGKKAASSKSEDKTAQNLELNRYGEVKQKRNKSSNKNILKPLGVIVEKEVSNQIKIYGVRKNISTSALVNQILKNFLAENA